MNLILATFKDDFNAFLREYAWVLALAIAAAIAFVIIVIIFNKKK